MPLASISKMYKTFPEYFAQKMSQHVKKRAERYKRADLINNNEDKEVSDAQKGRPPDQTNQSAACNVGTQVLMTKRSNTPLAAVSDGESDSNDTSPRVLSLVDTSRKRESPRPQTGGYFNDTVQFISRPRSSKVSPRTTASLDNVDLWEESDTESEVGNYDEIEGLTINPSKTIDLSILRRSRSPVACKRNRLEHAKIATTLTQQNRTKSSSRSRERVSPRDLRLGIKQRIRLTRKPKSPSFPNPESSVKIPHVPKPPTCAKFSTSKSVNSGTLPEDIINGNKPRTRRKSDVNNPVDPRVIREANIVNARRESSTVKSDKSQTITCQYSLPRNISTPILCSTPKIETGMDSLCCGESNDTLMSTSPSRKVQFNDTVTVRDGELSTVDMLRHSNNSAQVFKDRYLGRGRHRSSKILHESEDSENVDQSQWTIQMVC